MSRSNKITKKKRNKSTLIGNISSEMKYVNNFMNDAKCDAWNGLDFPTKTTKTHVCVFGVRFHSIVFFSAGEKSHDSQALGILF